MKLNGLLVRINDSELFFVKTLGEWSIIKHDEGSEHDEVKFYANDGENELYVGRESGNCYKYRVNQ